MSNLPKKTWEHLFAFLIICASFAYEAFAIHPDTRFAWAGIVGGFVMMLTSAQLKLLEDVIAGKLAGGGNGLSSQQLSALLSALAGTKSTVMQDSSGALPVDTTHAAPSSSTSGTQP